MLLVSSSDIKPAPSHPEENPAPLFDVERLEAALKRDVRGEVHFDAGSRALYATDASNYRQVPVGVVVPRDDDDVEATIAHCRRAGAPLLSRGGGTSLAGQTCNVAVILDFSKYMRHIIDLDPARRVARVQPGIVLDRLREAAEQHGLTFGPDPATHSRCTLGGMVGNNSCGVHSVMSGRTSENIEELKVFTYDGCAMTAGETSEAELEAIIRAGGRRGEIYSRMRSLRDRYADEIRRRFPQIPRRVSGYNIDYLLPEKGFHVARALVGSESTLVTVLEITAKLVHSPKGRTLVALGFPDVYSAADRVPEYLEHKPIGLEGFDALLMEDLRKNDIHLEDLGLLPSGKGWLLVEFGGEDSGESEDQARKFVESVGRSRNPPSSRIFTKKEEAKRVWEVRESALGATAIIQDERQAWPGWEDSAVAPAQLGSYLRELCALMEKFEYKGAMYGHFGDGCLHLRLNYDLKSAPGIRKFRAFIDEAADVCVRHGGSVSGEHGDGQARAELQPKVFGEDLVRAFDEFKAIWDPEWRMNPGKMARPYRITENLRYGEHFNHPNPATHFQYPDDNHAFNIAMQRCVGIGACRKTDRGTMCPSYMATREEKHSTRGRARLLWEMLEGDPLKSGWRDRGVLDSLDLCLSCKGCKGECPVHVDMATYKAEFLSHYYDGRLRPRRAYAIGLIFWWARVASKVPRLANFFTQSPGLRVVAKALAGFSQKRTIPAFATKTFREWFANRERGGETATPVLLWPDTFTNYFEPEAGKAAVEVLERAGFEVRIPDRVLCCGRPLYDYGMLTTAKKLLADILDTLRSDIDAGTPIVGLEPSCVSVFRDELRNLFPENAAAARLQNQTFLLSEFLEKFAPHLVIPKLARKALVHGHCHHKSLMKMTSETAILDKIGLDYSMPDDGCCGMAGGFGYEAEHYDVSMAVGQRRLLPAVRDADRNTLMISDGFSCRQQILQSTGRKAVHLAEALRMAFRNGAESSSNEEPSTRPAAWAMFAGAAALAITGALLKWRR